MLSNKAVGEFKTVYLRETGESLSDQGATAAANRLIALMGLIYRPIPKHKTKGKKEVNDGKS